MKRIYYIYFLFRNLASLPNAGRLGVKNMNNNQIYIVPK